MTLERPQAEKSRPALALFVGALGALGVGALDYLTGYYLSFSIFYLVPIALGGWLGGRVVGVVLSVLAAVLWYLADVYSGNPYPGWIFPVWNSAMRLGIFFTIVMLMTSLQRSLRKERLLSRVDPLTGLHNRRAFYELLEAERARSQRYQRPWSLAYLDLDNFKKMNDQFGHEAGDQALRFVADGLRARLRGTDQVARLGGDELAVLMPETDASRAFDVLEKVRQDLTATMQANGWPVGMSIGVITVAETRATVEEIVHHADEHMYEAKRAGKGRVYPEERARGQAASGPPQASPTTGG